jgi:hypothetical protein
MIVEYKGVEFEVEFDYQPYEPPERGPEAQYPGCAQYVEVYEIKHNGVDFGEILEDQLEAFEELILEKIHENE